MRGYAHLNPKLEYKKEAFGLFQGMLDSVAEEVVTTVFSFTPVAVDEEKLAHRWVINEIIKEEFSTQKVIAQMNQSRSDQLNEDESRGETIVKGEKIGRNEPCPCGSGKKYKKCCMVKQIQSK